MPLQNKVTLDEIIEQVDQLTQPPEVVMKASRLLEDNNCSADQLGNLIRLDSGMTAQVLRLCNSASYGLNRKVDTIKEAVALLGFNTLKSLIYTVLSHATLNRPLQGYGLDKGGLWLNAVTCGVYVRFMAQQHQLVLKSQGKTGGIDPEVAYTAAMLRDIGKLVLNDYVKANFTGIEETARSEALDFMEAEAEIIGFSHTSVGMRIAEKWNLPERLALVIGYHHKPSDLPTATSEEDRQLVTLVHVADTFTMLLGAGIGSDGLMYSLDMDALYVLGPEFKDNLETTMAQLVDMNDTIRTLSESITPVAKK